MQLRILKDETFRSWKKAPKCFEEHKNSAMHKFVLTLPQLPDIALHLVDNLSKLRKIERHYLMRIISSVRYLARQGIPFTGLLICFCALSVRDFEILITTKWITNNYAKFFDQISFRQ